MNKNIIMMIVHISLAIISFYFVAYPDLFNTGYALAIDGITIVEAFA